jgi:hypothetical protein
MAEKWSEWKELDGESLYATVPYEFPGSWEYHDAEFRMKDGSYEDICPCCIETE